VRKKLVGFVMMTMALLVLLPATLAIAEDGVFRACGKSWKVGSYGHSWNEAKVWIRNLETGWEIPTQDQVFELWQEVKATSCLGRNWVWADGAKTVGFGEGQRSSGNPDVRGNCVVIAVGPKWLTDGQTKKVHLEFKVGPQVKFWRDAETWANGLGKGWRIAKNAEMKENYDELKRLCKGLDIKQFWGEDLKRNDAIKGEPIAELFLMDEGGYKTCGSINNPDYGPIWALAVREK
jgi:hypothetical protein